MTPRSRSRLSGLGLAPRLLLNNVLVIVAGAGTVLVTALLVGPAVFEDHLAHVQPIPDPAVQEHVARAFDQAILVSLGVGIVMAALTGAGISWLAARRLAAPVSDAAEVASRLADGRLEERLTDPRMGPELSTLAGALNELGRRLDTTEQTRRRLTGDLAHQLRTPVASIGATIEAVREGVLPVDQQTLDTLAEQSARLDRLVGDLEVVSRAQERQLLVHAEPVAVSALVDAAVAAHREQYRAAGVDLSGSVDPHSPDVLVDRDRIHEVLGNLLDNALRHTPPGGTVRIASRPEARSARPGIIIEVEDSGNGFPAGEAERIFERYAKGEASTGSGLGLTIGRAIVEAHHGSLTASSEGPGRGARVTVWLPTGRPQPST
ncbi:MAG TPA: HAMP domain-containing sensor histidine kinase [Propionibacteriaceae bacterium]|nr:HAMP domain-containing sensor histidine kinase [Propionibacteriaceae bacterium]